ncbi:insulinase family protein [Pelagibaculum spongiae]|uniref:Protease 3 n=1 Tax=Pelagibaculum spongiae TaxID=2080658 RepID=A0A2V1GQH6_9GAMM|nr:insulinase family protein [Pelagibaculum spongiae]PVZ66288.1 hypothetical protein DC094_16420 [Pelagibaculum spongiae]
MPKLRLLPLVISGALVLSGCGQNPIKTVTDLIYPADPVADSVTQAANPADQIVIKSPADMRQYRYLSLDNGMQLLLISDEEADKAAAAVNVAAGSWQDPDNRNGLAHFLEHMLFLGNAKYPEVDGYFKFIQANGGGANAFTSRTHTNYFFDINAQQLQPALDQLAQFFVSPKLDPAYVDRERNAVDSEYKLHAKEDGWRNYLALGQTANPEHPASKFSIGNLQTLNNEDGTSLWQDLKDFYDTYYVSGNLSVVISGKEDLDTLESWAMASFKGVPEGPSTDNSIGIEPYTAKQKGVRINLEPLADTRDLLLEFPLPTLVGHEAEKPLQYLGKLLGHEGQGSLHSLLKSKGWIDSLGAGGRDVPGEYSNFSINMSLTPAGLENIDAITETVFGYLHLIHSRGIRESIFQEQTKLSDLSFQFQSKGSPSGTASGLAAAMQNTPAKYLLKQGYRFETFSPALINNYLERMTPQNLRQVVVAKGLETDQSEQWYGTKFSMKPLSNSYLKQLEQARPDQALDIAKANPFVPENLKVIDATDQQQPEQLINQPGLTAWFMHDNKFQRPRAYINLRLSTPVASASPENVVYGSLLTSLVRRSLNEYAYPAAEAGLGYGLSISREGLNLSVSGYSDKQLVLMKAVVEALKNTPINPEILELERHQLEEDINNQSFDKPFRQASSGLRDALFNRAWDSSKLLKAVAQVTPEQIEKYRQQLLSKLHQEMLFFGNIDADTAKDQAQQINGWLASQPAERFDESLNLLQGRGQYQLDLDIKHADSTLIRYYQSPVKSIEKRAEIGLLGRMIRSPFFNQLRTEQQLGYVVFAGPRPYEDRPGMVFVIQSPVADPKELTIRIDAFLEQQSQAMSELSDADLMQYKQGLIGDLRKKDTSLAARNGRLFGSIEEQDYSFDLRERIAQAVEAVTKDQLVESYQQLLANPQVIPLDVSSWGEKFRDNPQYQQLKGSAAVCFDSSCFNGLPKDK